MKHNCVVALLILSVLVSFARCQTPRLPSSEVVTANLPGAGFTDQVDQIPATVIDEGILRDVPYTSHKVGESRELNIYGDPAEPACIEIGVYGKLVSIEEEKKRCLAFMQRLVPSIDVHSIPLFGGKILKNGVVAEVTTPDSPDAYGGWWVSIYSLSLLRQAKGERESVNIVSVPREKLEDSGWSTQDLSRIRRSPVGSATRIWVRSYVRHDGTYVRSHSRGHR